MIALLLLQVSLIEHLPRQEGRNGLSLAYLQISGDHLVVSVPNLPCLVPWKETTVKKSNGGWNECPEPMFVDVGLIGSSFFVRINRKTGEASLMSLKPLEGK